MDALYYSIATVSLRLDTRTLLKKTGNYPVRMVVYHNYDKRSFTIPYRFTKDEWKKIQSKHLKDERLLDNKRKLKQVTDKAEKIISDLGDNFSFEDFDLQFSGQKAKKIRNQQNVYDGFKEKIQESNENEKFGTASIYKDAMVCLKKFRPELNYTQITCKLLNELELHLIKDLEYSITTVTIYMRCLRHVYKRAIKAKLISKDKLPFGKGGDDDD
ncbi:MAG: phage integrase SAM-like domain-containing protein, partial [Clostridia bacterium]|nr:phage integrase SAM-like domain-containing protein [Clostridia bacterium]